MNTRRTRSKRQWNRKVAPLLLILCGLFPGSVLPGANAESPAGDISGKVSRIDVKGNSAALSGILITLRIEAENAPLFSAQSDSEGCFHFTGLTAGRYVLEVNVQGFKPFAATIDMQPGQTQVQDVRLELATVAVSVEVQGQSDEVTEHASDPNTTITDNQMEALPMAQQQYSEALPVVAGVVRTMNGTLNIEGAAETQGMLLVDSMQMVDPVTGGFSVGVPLAGIDTLNVFETPYNAQYGGFSGGLASIETKSPPSQWQYSLMDFVPGMRAKNGHIAGMSVETPRAFVGGPLIKDKLNISEAFDYTIKNRPVRGQPWPKDESKMRGFNSFTNAQAILSPKHLLTANAVVFSNRTEFADMNALVPETASSNSGAKGAFATLIASDVFSAGTLNTMFRYSRFESNAYGQGDQDLLMTPEGLSGNAFNRWARTANQFELMPSFLLQRKKWHGSHELRLGTDIVHQNYHGTTHSDPIQVLREDHSLAELIDFSGSGLLHGRETEVSEFVQDHWVANNRLAVDFGFRITSQSGGRSGALAPRMGLVYSLDKTHKTVLRAGTGVFYDRVPLLALSFLQNQTRVITLYNEAGLMTGGPVALQNAYLDFTSTGSIVRTSGSPGNSPRNVRWDVELDRELNSRTSFKLSYLQSQTSDVYVVGPWTGVSDSNPVLGLSPTGESHYREFQASLHYRAGRRGDLTVTYLHSQAKGSLNTLSDIYVPFEQPIIRPDASGYLASDVPDRLLSSGIFRLPYGFTVSPILDLHTGFRYSNMDVLDNYVGTPNSQHLPTYFSLDMKVFRDFNLPRFSGPLKDRRFRVGIYSMNVTNHLNPHDVFNNVDSPVFGHPVGFQHRVNGFLIDFVK